MGHSSVGFWFTPLGMMQEKEMSSDHHRDSRKQFFEHDSARLDAICHDWEISELTTEARQQAQTMESLGEAGLVRRCQKLNFHSSPLYITSRERKKTYGKLFRWN